MYKNIKKWKGSFCLLPAMLWGAGAAAQSYRGTAPEYRSPPDIRGSRGQGGGPQREEKRKLKEFIGPT